MALAPSFGYYSYYSDVIVFFFFSWSVVFQGKHKRLHQTWILHFQLKISQHEFWGCVLMISLKRKLKDRKALCSGMLRDTHAASVHVSKDPEDVHACRAWVFFWHFLLIYPICTNNNANYASDWLTYNLPLSILEILPLEWQNELSCTIYIKLTANIFNRRLPWSLLWHVLTYLVITIVFKLYTTTK